MAVLATSLTTLKDNATPVTIYHGAFRTQGIIVDDASAQGDDMITVTPSPAGANVMIPKAAIDGLSY